MHNISKAIESRRVSLPVAAGTTAVQTTAIDMRGYEGVEFVALFGALTATQVTAIHLEQSDDGITNWNALAGSKAGPLADADSNKLLISEVYKPKKRFVRCVVDRGTANAVVDSVIANLYAARYLPTPLDVTVSKRTTTNSPAEGTP
jgi:hypothetical protein